jgi:pimeloyl-ACP methyl ester carboxylesterase
MPHVTFIHGIGNKLAPDQLRRHWLGALAEHDLDLDAQGVSSSLVYWADFLYPSPVVSEVDYEAATDVEDGSVPDIGMRWMVEATGEDAALVERLAATIGFQELADDEPVRSAAAPVEAEGFERVPLPPWLKRRLMKIFLRDVHHYLFDSEFSPRPGETYRIQDAIRKRVCEALADGAGKEPPHVLVTHSMGTVIAYDCLKRVPGCPAVDGLLTIGSPLGLDDIQDGLKPEWSRPDGFPGELLRGRWVNIYDPLDPVAGFDPDLAHDYQRAGVSVVEDFREDNWGRWRHSIDKYFAGKTLRTKLAEVLGLSSAG